MMPIKHKKTDEYICPRCGKDNSVVDNWNFDVGYMVRRMYCEDCGYSWREYFVVAYDGFTDDTGEYNSDGVQLESYADDGNPNKI